MSDIDLNRPIIMNANKTVCGHALRVGTPLVITASPEKAGEVTEAMAKRLLKSGIAIYADQARPTPVESRRDEALRVVTREDIGGGWHAINAPWFEAPLKVQGTEAADRAYNETIEAGRPDAPLEPLDLGVAATQIPPKSELTEGLLPAGGDAFGVDGAGEGDNATTGDDSE